MLSRIRLAFGLLFLSIGLVGCGAGLSVDSAAQAAPAQPALRPTATLPPVQRLSTPPANASTTQRLNPFGLLVGGDNLTDQHRVDLAKALGVTYFRPWYVTVEDWGGACLDPACELAQAAGLKLILTIRNNANLGGTTPATDLNAYQAKLSSILDKYQPEVIVVENEESSAQSWAGSVDQYAAELKAACSVAHQKNVKCTNGGLDSLTVGLLVWADAIERGLTTEACDFVQRASADLPIDLCRLTAVDQLFPAYRDQVTRGRQLLEVYETSGQDYLNFHWYVPDKVALSNAAAYLRRATNLPLMSNELGQRDQSPEPVDKLLSAALDLQLQYAVWFSLDRTSQALQDENGALRPNGEAFRAFMQAHYQSTAELPAAAPTQVPNVVAAAPLRPTVPSFAGKPAAVSASDGLTFTQMLSDVTYCTADDGTELKMDLYFPIKPAGPAPVVMFVHGGGWVAGTKTGTPGMSYFLELARRGYLIASIDYRLAPTSTFPANIEDVKCAVRSLRAHAAEWNLDPNHIGAWGASAGGHLVALLGTADESAGWDVGQYLDQSSRVQAVVDLYGIADLTTEYVVGGSRSLDRMVFKAKGLDDPILKAASVPTYITPDDPPFLIMHGDFDETVPYTQSVMLQSALETGGVSSTLVIVHNGGHGFWARGGPIDPPYPVIARTILNFFDQYLR
ncbi:MAG: alpha/beta hydrolase [Anaerolineae bacterium]